MLKRIEIPLSGLINPCRIRKWSWTRAELGLNSSDRIFSFTFHEKGKLMTKNVSINLYLDTSIRLRKTHIHQTDYTGELGYDRLNGTRKIGPSYAKSVLYTYDEYLICIGLGHSISSVICKNPSYSGPSYPSSPVQSLRTFEYNIQLRFLNYHSFLWI